MKMFDCSQCKHKQNHALHCLFYQSEPEIDICPSYQLQIDENAVIGQKINQLIKRKANDLLDSFMEFGYNNSDWIQIIKSALYHAQIDPYNMKEITKTIRSFGQNGLSFTCDKCKNAVELEDDTNITCPNCGKTTLSLTI